MTDAREIISRLLRREFGPHADRVAIRDFFQNIEAAGFRILGPDEVDPVTVEQCADVVEEKADSYADPKEVSLWDCAKPTSVRLYGAAAAIRALGRKI